jgi:hypothetical protein
MKRNAPRFLLDIIILIALLILMDLDFTNLAMHERLGIALAGVLIIHTAQHLPWVRAVIAQRRRGQVQWKMGYMWVLSLLLGASCIVTSFTGLLISRTLPFIHFSVNSYRYTLLHHSAAYLSIMLAGLHLGVHARAVLVHGLKHIPAEFKILAKKVSQGIAMLILLAGIRTYVLLEYNEVLLSPLTGNSPLLQSASNASNYTPQQDSQSFQQSSEAEEMEDFISTLICRGCSKRCSLLQPYCQIGLKQRRDVETLIYENRRILQEVKAEGSDNNGRTKMFCAGCSYHCPLTQPQCLIGVRELLTATNIVGGRNGPTTDTADLQFPLVMGMFLVGSHYFTGWQDQIRARKRNPYR